MVRIIRLILNLLLIALVSCAQTEQTPLDPAQMEEILYELHLMDGWVDRKGGSLTIRNQVRDEVYDEVLERYGMDRPTFWRAYQYYIEHPTELDSIYNRLITRTEAEVDSLRTSPKSREKSTPTDTTRKPSSPSPSPIVKKLRKPS